MTCWRRGSAADAAANLVGTGPADPDRRVRSVEQTKEQPPPASLQTSLGTSHIGQRTPSGLNPGSLPHPSNGSQPRHRIRKSLVNLERLTKCPITKPHRVMFLNGLLIR